MLAFLLVVLFSAPSGGPSCVLPDNTVVSLELALTDEQKALGLMFRDVLPPSHGMLFVFDREGFLPFWMKNTLIPLDFIWLDSGGTVVDVKASVPPCNLDPCPSYKPSRPARAMLELAAGQAAAHGVKPGVRLTFSGVPGFPVKDEGNR